LLVKVKKEFDFDAYVEAENGSIITEDYPNTKHGIFLANVLSETEVFVSELVRASRLIPRSENKPGAHIALDLDGKMVYPPVLEKALQVLSANGEERITLFTGEDRIQLQGNRTLAVVMTLGIKGNPDARCKEAYTVAQILAMEDLL